jgi:hypothetical protein
MAWLFLSYLLFSGRDSEPWRPVRSLRASGQGRDKVTINREPRGIETLDLQTRYVHSWNKVEYVRIGVVREDAKGEDGKSHSALSSLATMENVETCKPAYQQKR